MSPLQFRDAVLDDLPEIIAMLADDPLGAKREDTSLPLDGGYVAAFAAIQASPDQRLIVAVENGRLVGTMQLSFLSGLSRKGGWRGQIEGVRIVADRRGARLGEQLVLWGVDQCRARGCYVAQLTTHESRKDAHRFYDRLGFQATHLGYKLELASLDARPAAS